MTDMAQLAAAYRTATDVFIAAAAQVTDANIDVRHPDGWSARQIVHHMADSEAQSYARLRRLLAEPGSTIQGYDEDAWSRNPKLGYEALPIENALAVFVAVRAASLDLVQRLAPADLELHGEHTERGRFAVADWLRIYSNHPRDHAEQLLKALRGEA